MEQEMMNRERNATDSRWTGPAGAQEAQGPLPFPSQRPRKHRPGATRSPGARPGEPGGHGASAAHLARAARVPPGRAPISRELGSLTRTAGQETRASHLGGRGGPPAAPHPLWLMHPRLQYFPVHLNVLSLDPSILSQAAPPCPGSSELLKVWGLPPERSQERERARNE